jgi:hypothetical protein
MRRYPCPAGSKKRTCIDTDTCRSTDQDRLSRYIGLRISDYFPDIDRNPRKTPLIENELPENNIVHNYEQLQPAL